MSKKWWLTLAIVLSFLSVGAISESNRIHTSDAPDIVQNRERLEPMSYAMTSALVGAAIFCWYRALVKPSF